MTTVHDAILAAEAPCAGLVLASGPSRALVAQALGQCEAGVRTTAVVRGDELVRIVDLLQDGARRLCPLVVRTTVAGDHGGLFAIADTGAIVLLARAAAEVPIVHLVARLLAERALLPVVIAVAPPIGDEPPPAMLPPAAVELLGEASDSMPSATPAQEMLFGSQRRRVVRWFDLERPVLRGQHAETGLRQLQHAGTAPFFHSPVAELVQQVAAEVQLATGTAWSPVSCTNIAKASVLVVALGDATGAIAAHAATVENPRFGAIVLHQLRPFPDQWLALLRNRKAVIVVGAIDTALGPEPPLLREVRAALARAQATDRSAGRPWKDKEVPTLHAAIAGLGGAALQPHDLAAFASECAEGHGRALVYLGVEFTPLQNKLPKRLVLHEALRRAHPGIERLGLRTQTPRSLDAVPAAPLRVPVPAHQQQPTHDNLTSCWDFLAGPMVAGTAGELAPDPYLTAGSAPALSSLCRGNAAGPSMPVLEPSKCTACGACWTVCPDGAWLPVVLGTTDLLEAGLRAAQDAGRSAEVLRPVLGRLAKALPNAIQAGARTASAAVQLAAEPTLGKVDADKKPAMQQATSALADALDGLPLALTEPFFQRVERQRPGSGNLFALALDADACKGCNLCVAVCAPQALAAHERTAAGVQTARAAAALWRALPDTKGTVIADARELAEPGLLGALELSRHCLHALAPGDSAEPGSGPRSALRTVLALAEAHLQPRLQPHLRELDELGAEFGKRIRDLLAGALPAADLDALHEGLATLGTGAVALSALAARLDEGTAAHRVDSSKLQRLVDTARALADLRWRIAEGRNGLGRARTGLVLAGGETTAFAQAFPWNPFAAPAVLDGSPEAGHRALGLLRGQADALASDFALLRRAKAVLQQGTPGPRTLTFAELTPAERDLCPPLLLITDASALQHGGLPQLAAALATDLPIKVLLLADAITIAPHLEPALLALAHRQAFVLQTSIAHRDHFATGVLAACRHPGPALLHVLAPSPARAGVAADQAQTLAAAAVQSRAFPLLRYDPARPGAFGEKLSLDGNPDPAADGTGDPLHLAAWRMLQELAGVRTPFTQQVERHAAAAVADAHSRQLAELQARHDHELQQARATVEQELLARLQHKLTVLAGGHRP